MKCPLSCIGDYGKEHIINNPSFDCLGKECAWWDNDYGRCAILRIAIGIDALVGQLERLNDGIRLVK